VAHGKSTVVKAISGVQTVRFKNELERNITIKLGYANAKIYKCEDDQCPRPACYRAYGGAKRLMPVTSSTRALCTRFVSYTASHDEASDIRCIPIARHHTTSSIQVLNPDCVESHGIL